MADNGNQQDTQSLVPVVEPWTDELLWFCPKDSGQRQMLHKNSKSDTSNGQGQEKKLGTKTKLKPSGYHSSLQQQRSQHQKHNHVQHWEEGYQEGKI